MHYWDSEQPIRLPRLDTLPYFPAKVQAKRILAELKREFPKQSQLRQFVKALVARFGPELLCHVAKPDLALTHMEDLVYSVVSANPAGYGYGGSAESLRDIIFGSDEWLEFLKSADTSPASQSAIPTREENNVITAVRVTPLAGSGNAPVVSTPTAVKAAATREDLFKEFFRSVPARELAKTSPRTFVHWAISQKKTPTGALPYVTGRAQVEGLSITAVHDPLQAPQFCVLLRPQILPRFRCIRHEHPLNTRGLDVR